MTSVLCQSNVSMDNASNCTGMDGDSTSENDPSTFGTWVSPAQLIKILTTIFVPLVFGLIVVVGIIGNALVIVVVATNAQMRSTTNVLILNLAVADLLFIVLCVPFTATDYVLNYWPFGLVWCQTVQYLIYATSYVSIYTLILMSIDRFMAVVYPVASLGFRTVRNATLAIFITWTIIAVVTMPVWMTHHLLYKTIPGNGTVENETVSIVVQPEKAWCRFANEDYSERGFYIAFFVSSYAIPLLLIVLLYIGMLRRLWNPGSIGNKISKESLRNKRRVTRLVLVVIVVFSVCWAPIQFVLLFKAIGRYRTKSAADYPRIIFQICSHVLAYVNSCVNPIVYAFLSDNFRKAFRHLLPKCLQFGGLTHPGHHALRYELTTLKASTRSNRSLRGGDERRRKPNKLRQRSQSQSGYDDPPQTQDYTNKNCSSHNHPHNGGCSSVSNSERGNDMIQDQDQLQVEQQEKPTICRQDCVQEEEITSPATPSEVAADISNCGTAAQQQQADPNGPNLSDQDGTATFEMLPAKRAAVGSFKCENVQEKKETRVTIEPCNSEVVMVTKESELADMKRHQHNGRGKVLCTRL